MRDFRSAKLIVGFLGTGLLASACTPGDESLPSVQSGANAAPGHLQRKCQAEGAIRFGADRDKALIVSSARASGNSYRINLKLGGRRAICVIDDNGFIESLDPG